MKLNGRLYSLCLNMYAMPAMASIVHIATNHSEPYMLVAVCADIFPMTVADAITAIMATYAVINMVFSIFKSLSMLCACGLFNSQPVYIQKFFA